MTSTSGAATAARTLTEPEAELLARWQGDAERSALAHLRRSGISPETDLAADLAQEALLRLLVVARRGQAHSERYIRRVLANAVKRGAARMLSGTDLDVGDEMLDAIHEPPADEDRDVLADARIRTWVADLRPALQRTYFNVYVLGTTQRAAAVDLGVTQPRVAQLHAQLLTLGHEELRSLAA